jgi:hypothetical protein
LSDGQRAAAPSGGASTAEDASSPEVFAQWLRLQGHRVERTASSWWYDASPRVYQAFPFHWIIRPSDEELAEFLQRTRGLALRYSTPLDAPAGRVSYHVVCEDREYGLKTLERRTRQAVRHGLERCRVERLPLERLASEGWALEVDTCRRHGRSVSVSEQEWRRRHLAAAELPGFEAWGALVGGRLAASLLCARVDGWIELIAQQSLEEFLDARANNALTFVVTQTMLQRPGVHSVFYTLQSLDAPASVDTFKFRMGYAARPVRQRVVFHPWAARAIGPWATRVLRAALQRCPQSRILSKAEGMLRFHLVGKQPAAEQVWPACLTTTGADRLLTPPPAGAATTAG